MSRLTRKLNEPIDTKYLHYDYLKIADYDIERKNYGRITDADIYNKLGQIEDVEEIYYKLIENRVYYKKHIYGIKRYTLCSEDEIFINIVNKLFIVFTDGLEYYDTLEIDRYGKAWALTKEELEDDK